MPGNPINKDAVVVLTLYEFKLRYRGSVLGIGWSLLAPFMLAIVLWIVFGNIFSNMGGKSYALFILLGVFVYRFFSLSTTNGMFSIISKSQLVTKTNLNRMLLPLITTFTHAISSLLELVILLPIIFHLGGKLFIITVLLIIPVHLLYFMFILGLNMILSTAMVYFRDLNQIWEILLNILFFATPIAYPIEVIPKKYSLFIQWNPLTRFVNLYRSTLIEGKFPLQDLFYVVLASSLAIILGLLIFKRYERHLGEVI